MDALICTGRLKYVQCRRACNAGEVPLQHSVVLHNVSTAAGDDASHSHAQDETPTELDTGELLT